MPEANNLPVLRVIDAVAGYGQKRVLDSVSLDLHSSEVVGIIGHNGAGKTTLLKAIFGVTPLFAGTVMINNEVIIPTPPRLLNRGVLYVPQRRSVFDDLSVQENLEIGSSSRDQESVVQNALQIFPVLQKLLARRTRDLSGGEKQMVALARALALQPRILLLDEPTIGLAPAKSARILDLIVKRCRDEGTAALIVEQRVREVVQLADRVYVLRNGTVGYTGSAVVLRDETKLREAYL